MSYIIPFVLIIHTLIAAALVGVILLQRSEGGALGIGQNTSGLVSARGAADLLTRSTSILAGVFVVTSLLLAILYGQTNKTRRIEAGAPVPTQSAPLTPGATPAPVPVLPGAGGAPGSTGGVPLFPSAAPADLPPNAAQTSPLNIAPTQPPVEQTAPATPAQSK